jgi:cyclopropane fatty-acyl-phospholipid synthase-like methyltransferase
MENVNNSYFDGYYKDIWRSIIPAELTVKEVDFMLNYFKLQPGNNILDLMCGYGRHAIALAQKGMAVTAVDNLDEYINEINKTAISEKLAIKAIKADVIKYEADQMYNLVLCMGNSLCFFDRADTIRLLKMIASHLVKGGSFLINTWMIAEIAFNGFKEKSWSNVGDLKYIFESKYLLRPSRIETDHLILSPDGKTETKKAIDYIYSIAETEQMLNETGFVMKEVYSIPGRKKFTLGDPRAYIIAEKE